MFAPCSRSRPAGGCTHGTAGHKPPCRGHADAHGHTPRADVPLPLQRSVVLPLMAPSTAAVYMYSCCSSRPCPLLGCSGRGEDPPGRQNIRSRCFQLRPPAPPSHAAPAARALGPHLATGAPCCRQRHTPLLPPLLLLLPVLTLGFLTLRGKMTRLLLYAFRRCTFSCATPSKMPRRHRPCRRMVLAQQAPCIPVAVAVQQVSARQAHAPMRVR